MKTGPISLKLSSCPKIRMLTQVNIMSTKIQITMNSIRSMVMFYRVLNIGPNFFVTRIFRSSLNQVFKAARARRYSKE